MGLQRYLLRRILQLFPVILVVIILNFVLIQAAPGDAAYAMASENAQPEYLERVRQKYGLDRPVHEQLLIYLGRIFQGDLGDSFRFRQPVLEVIGRHFWPTMLLVMTGLLIAVVVGTLIGTLVTQNAGSFLDTSVSVLAIISYSIPTFWLGLALILLFAIRFRWFPASGMQSPLGPREGPAMVLDVMHHLALPALSLSLVWMGQYVRLARSSVLQVLNEDYITTARAVGFGSRTILIRHALRNALLPIVSVFGLQLGLVFSGAVLTETVFAWPGLGRMLYDAIIARDTAVIMGTYIILAVSVTVASLLTDLVYVSLDPRVKYR